MLLFGKTTAYHVWIVRASGNETLRSIRGSVADGTAVLGRHLIVLFASRDAIWLWFDRLAALHLSCTGSHARILIAAPVK
jgi:hypothetical protein